MSRSFEAVRADLQLVDCGSLDVLMYCSDEVDATTRDTEVAVPANVP